MVNEWELERALSNRGFVVINPETLSVQRQIALMQHAEVIVSSSGAALASAVFCPPGATVVEIIPPRYNERWLRLVAHARQLRWRGYFTQSSGEANRDLRALARQLPRIAAGRYNTRFALHVPSFEAFLLDGTWKE